MPTLASKRQTETTPLRIKFGPWRFTPGKRWHRAKGIGRPLKVPVGFQFVREEPFTMGKSTGRIALLSQKTYTTFAEGKNLPDLCKKLLSEQKNVWQDLQKGYESFKDIRARDLPCRGFSVRLQYNPGRIKSSTADVAEKNRAEQQCFLCLDHLPQGQKGISYRNDYLILCNPMPVFSSHFTVSHVDHRLQAIAEHVDAFLQLMADFGSGWVILYNGPKCGASAPDHLHFQAAPSGQMPIEKEIREEKRLTLMKQVDGVLFHRVRDLGREAVVLQAYDSMALGKALREFLDALKKVLLIDEEPMTNIAGFYEESKWCLVIFPRRKHRPEAFSRKGADRIVVSPGAIDMGGVLITPVEEDFYRLDRTLVESIFNEVSLDGKTVERAMDSMEGNTRPSCVTFKPQRNV
jgi:hypothetical protein